MDNVALAVHRLHFAFTVTFHYLFPQLTMGLALLILILKTKALRTGDEHANRAARFWGKIFGVNFVLGVVTGIPMEFQFGTNWAEFARAAGGVIGQTLAMEGVFSFFLESAFLGLFLFGEKRLGPRGHWFAALMVFVGSWLSGYFIIATNAWMQHPVGHRVAADGQIVLVSFWRLLLHSWALWQFIHNMSGAVTTGCFFMAGIGAFYLLRGKHVAYGRTFVSLGVRAGLVAALVQLFPSGDQQAMMVARHQPATLAAMEGLFQTQRGAHLSLIGLPDVGHRELDSAIRIPRLLSLLAYKDGEAEVKGLDSFPPEDWPDKIPLLFQSYHLMVALGMLFIAITVVSAWLLWRGRLYTFRPMLRLLALAWPLPFVANSAGWITAELGRQPWLIYGLMRTKAGASPQVAAGAGAATLVGFVLIYAALGALGVFLVRREISHGPEAEAQGG